MKNTFTRFSKDDTANNTQYGEFSAIRVKQAPFVGKAEAGPSDGNGEGGGAGQAGTRQASVAAYSSLGGLPQSPLMNYRYPKN